MMTLGARGGGGSAGLPAAADAAAFSRSIIPASRSSAFCGSPARIASRTGASSSGVGMVTSVFRCAISLGSYQLGRTDRYQVKPEFLSRIGRRREAIEGGRDVLLERHPHAPRQISAREPSVGALAGGIELVVSLDAAASSGKGRIESGDNPGEGAGGERGRGGCVGGERAAGRPHLLGPVGKQYCNISRLGEVAGGGKASISSVGLSWIGFAMKSK